MHTFLQYLSGHLRRDHTAICSALVICHSIRLCKGREISNMRFFPALMNKCWSHLCVRCASLQGLVCVRLLECVSSLLVGQVCLGVHVWVWLWHCVRMCPCVVYQLVRRQSVQGTWAGMAFQCVECFLPYIAMTDYVVSPVVAGGQERSSRLAPLPLSVKPEHKCSLLESHGLVHMCSSARPVD